MNELTRGNGPGFANELSKVGMLGRWPWHLGRLSFPKDSVQPSHDSLRGGLAQHRQWAKWPGNLSWPSDALTLFFGVFFPQENIQATFVFCFFCISENYKLAI